MPNTLVNFDILKRIVMINNNKNVRITLGYVSVGILIFYSVEIPLETEHKILTTYRTNKQNKLIF